MDKKDYFILGRVSKTFSNKGELVFYLDVDQPQRYNQLTSVFIELNNTLVPFFIHKIQVKGNNANVLLEGIDTSEKASELINAYLFLPLNLLPPLGGKRFYFHEVPGFTVTDKTQGNIGVVEQILDLPHQAVFQIKFGDNEILVPVKDTFILNIDRQKKQIELDVPEGLIDIYLNK